MKKLKATNITRILVLKNSKSTHIRLANRYIDEINGLLPQAETVTLQTAATPRRTQEILKANKALLGPQTLLVIAGGDGTVNVVAEFLLGEPSLPKSSRNTPIFPLWAGNANDLAYMLNGPVFRVRLPQLLNEASIVPIYPLVCTLTNSEGRTTIYRAVSYASFGVTASLARELNTHAHRQGSWRRWPLIRGFGEVITLVRTFVMATTFTVEERGQQKELYERSYVNGTRMGKFHPFAGSLTDKYFVKTTVGKQHKHIFAFWRWFADAMRRPPTHDTGKSSVFTALDPMWMQVDGEHARLKRDTKVHIVCSSVPLYVVSMRLKTPTSKPLIPKKL